ncbi:MAG: acetyl-CoA carboxylase biotin carboxyl carrier protein [Saprospiraceae bacterium]|nr:acetyl-CoA carboxylase biotin carboxyl carrier protein [Saprospiraceae bacterium]
MKFREIQDLIKLISDANIDEFSLEQDEFKLSIINNKEAKVIEGSGQPQIIHVPAAMPQQQFAPAAPQVQQQAPQVAAPKIEAAPAVPPPAAAASTQIEVKSPIVGTFYRSSSPDKPVFVKVGDKIQKGQVVCIVEAMKLFNEIESEVSGTIVKVLVEDAQPVEYDQALFLVEP